MTYGIKGGDTPQSDKWMEGCVSKVAHQTGKDGKILGKQKAIAICKTTYMKSKANSSVSEDEYLHLDLKNLDMASMGMPMDMDNEQTPMAITGYNPVDLLYVDVDEVTYLQTCMRKKIGEGEDPDAALIDCYTEYSNTVEPGNNQASITNSKPTPNTDTTNKDVFMKVCMKKMMDKGKDQNTAHDMCMTAINKSGNDMTKAEYIINTIIAKYSK